ncbi:phosphotransferase-like protein [Actinopolymorpha pittospori]
MTNRQPDPTLVIVVSGPSSAGKTSLARALQQCLPVPAVLVEADRAFPDVPHTHPGWDSPAADTELTARERTRPEARPAGWAVRQARDIHEGMHYAALVDTSVRSSQECAEDVLAQLGLDAQPTTPPSPHHHPVPSGPRPERERP